MKALNILAIACAALISLTAAPTAQASWYHRHYGSYRYYSRPAYYAYHRPYYAYNRSYYAYHRPYYYYSRPHYVYSRPYYYYQPTVFYDDPYCYDYAVYPRYYYPPAFGLTFSFGGHHWRHWHH